MVLHDVQCIDFSFAWSIFMFKTLRSASHLSGMMCRKHNILMRYFLSNIRFVSCHSFGILSLANDLDMETFALSLYRIYLCILHPNNINDCSIFCSLRVLYIRHRSVLVRYVLIYGIVFLTSLIPRIAV